MLSNCFDPKENLFRAVVHPTQWDDDKNLPSTALFKDSKGPSFDRQAERSIEESTLHLLGRHPESRAIISLVCADIISSGAQPFYDWQPNNEFHSLITRPDGTTTLSCSVLKKLKEKSIVRYKSFNTSAP